MWLSLWYLQTIFFHIRLKRPEEDNLIKFKQPSSVWWSQFIKKNTTLSSKKMWALKNGCQEMLLLMNAVQHNNKFASHPALKNCGIFRHFWPTIFWRSCRSLAFQGDESISHRANGIKANLQKQFSLFMGQGCFSSIPLVACTSFTM